MGLRLDVIYPADAPHTALLSMEGRKIRLTSDADVLAMADGLASFAPEFLISRAAATAAPGRAGMLYRDLIPGRLGGRYIASHITIAEGGPVADWVHYHRVAFQMIFVAKGWVRVVYEGQGDPFVMHSGDLVLQPPGIRHRVLESSAGLEVIEIGCPALHETLADHDLALPDAPSEPERLFSGQTFLHHVAQDHVWIVASGMEIQDTAMAEATGGVASVRILRSGNGERIAIAPYDGELVFGYVIEGSASLDYRGATPLGAGDAFVIPPRESWGISAASDFRMLHVTTAHLA